MAVGLASTATGGGIMGIVKRRIGYSETGHRIGETHHNARHSDELVRLALELHDDGCGVRKIVRLIAEERGVVLSANTVKGWVTGRRRGLLPRAWKIIMQDDDE